MIGLHVLFHVSPHDFVITGVGLIQDIPAALDNVVIDGTEGCGDIATVAEVPLEVFVEMEMAELPPPDILENPLPRPRVSLDVLIRDLDTDNEDMSSQGESSPPHSSCTNVGDDQDMEVDYVTEEMTEYCTCNHVDVEVTSGVVSDADILIFCCGQYKSLTEACVCAV